MRPLSQRETEILALFDQGLELKEIADHLNLSPHTVVTYARRIIAKTDDCYSLRRACWLRRQDTEPRQ